MMFFASLKMMLLPTVAMMRCLPRCARRHTSLGEAVIIGTANIICRGQTSFKKRTLVTRQKCVFCWRRRRDLRTQACAKMHFNPSFYLHARSGALPQAATRGVRHNTLFFNKKDRQYLAVLPIFFGGEGEI